MLTLHRREDVMPRVAFNPNRPVFVVGRYGGTPGDFEYIREASRLLSSLSLVQSTAQYGQWVERARRIGVEGSSPQQLRRRLKQLRKRLQRKF